MSDEERKDDTEAKAGTDEGRRNWNRLLELPPLPKPQRYFGHSDTLPMYGPDEMVAFALEAVKAEREACAKKVSGNYGWIHGVYFDDLGDALRSNAVVSGRPNKPEDSAT